MKRLLLLLCLALTGCSSDPMWQMPDFGIDLGQPFTIRQKFNDPVRTQYPAVRIPLKLRQHNWLGSQGEGSCVHASMVMAFRSQGRFKTADWWKNHNGNGEWDTDLAAKFDRANIRYAYTSEKNDVAFLDKMLASRRPCGVTVMGGRHMILLVHLDKKWAGLIDNNFPDKIKWVPRKAFLAEWKHSHSWAVAPIYTPSPPRVPRTPS